MESREAQQLAAARARLRHIGALLVGWVALGTIANAIVLGGGLWNAFIFTVDTLAYLATRQEGVAWVIQVVLLHGGTVITWYIGWYLVDLVMDKHLWRNLRESKRMKEIEQLSDHVIVCGGGRVGAHLASMLAEKGARFVVVELDPDRAGELRAQGCAVLEGDAREETVLAHAGIARARRVVAALPSAERNVFVVLASKRLRGDVEIDARCEDERLAATLRQAGAARVILPERACAEQIVVGLDESAGKVVPRDDRMRALS
jgi:FlaA1/EpsC-like NDP-sugar epimerase